MTSFAVERTFPNGKGGVTRQKVIMPVAQANDDEFGTFFALQLREFLYRQGINVAHIPDETLCVQTRNTFANTRARDGRISSAKPVESGV